MALPNIPFARITDYTQQNAIVKNLLLGIIILILSIASYYFIERPFRNKKNNFKILLSVIIIFILILLTFNYKVVLNKGYRDRLPEILKSNFSGILWKGLKNSNGEICFSNLQGCKFNTSANKKVYIIGDSHAGSLMLDLKDKVVEKKYQFITLVSSGCLYFPGFNLVDKKTGKVNEICNQEYFNKIKKILSKETNSIFIFSGRFPLYISNIYFDNQEDGVEGKEWYENYVSVGKYESLQSSFRNEVLELSKNNKIILVYPIPEVGWSPRRKILSQSINRKNKFSKNFELTYITTSFDVLKNRNELSFELLDSIRGDNIYRVYPQNLFCDTTIKDRCVTHDKENVFYTDAHHPSYKGAEMINDLIMKEVEKIELKPN